MRLHYFSLLIIIFYFGCTKDSERESDTDATPNTPAETKTYSLTVSVSPKEGGSVSPSSGTFEEGSVVKIEGTPSNGYLFKEWSGDVQGTNTSISVTMDSNKSIVGTFEKTPALSYKDAIITLRNRIIEIIRPDGDPSWSYSFDLENDGDLDMILLRSGPAGYPKKEMILFKNNENKEFEEIQTGIDCWGRTVVFDDFNGDGFTDFFVPDHGYDIAPFPGGQDQMIYQTLDGGLVDMTNQVLPAWSNFSHGGCSIDLENDGDRDLIVNTGVNQYVLRNDNGVWSRWDEGIDPAFQEGVHGVEGHPTIDGEIRMDIWQGIPAGYWSRSGDFNNDGLDDLIIGCGMTDLNDGIDDLGRYTMNVDPYGNVLEKGDLIFLQDPISGNLIYEYPSSVVEHSWRSKDVTGGLTFGLLVNDFNNDGCLDFVSYGNNPEIQRVEFKFGDCAGGFPQSQLFQVYSPPNGDTLWEEFELVDVDTDGDMDVVVSNSIQWYDAHLLSEEHVIFINENGQFNQRNGKPEDLSNLPPHVAISWFLGEG